jgi:hypothetical protein
MAAFDLKDGSARWRFQRLRESDFNRLVARTGEQKGTAANAEKENSNPQSVDQRGLAPTQGALESKNACGGGRQGDEADRRGSPTKGKNDWHSPRTPALTERLATAKAGDAAFSFGRLFGDRRIFPL